MKELLKYKILQYTETHKISVRKLERAAGFKENTINQIFNGRSQNPSMETVVKISDAINCSLDEIFEREKFFKMTYTYDTNIGPEQ
jgi:transcriptional regulator with XRE-family HTH domain